MPNKKLEAVKNRIDAPDLFTIRTHRDNNYQSWHARIALTDRLYEGNWAAAYPDEQVRALGPMVMNLVQTEMDDISTLAAESEPSVRIWPRKDTKEAQDKSYFLESIAENYWERNRGREMETELTLDLVGTGVCFVVVEEDDEGFPCFRRIDPRMAYPNVFRNEVFDLFVAQEMKIETARMVFANFTTLYGSKIPADMADACEVWEYYSADECIQGLCLTRNGAPVEGTAEIIHRWVPKAHPVAFARMPSYDGAFRGMFDQIGGSLLAKNRLVQLTLDYADQAIYSPLISKGLLNEDEMAGPNAHYRLDPNVGDAQIGRMQPATSNPQLYGLLDFLDREQRAGTAYPTSRHGEVSQSIASAAFVNSTMGQLTSVVRKVQRLVGRVREKALETAFAFDREGSGKSETRFLRRPVGRKGTYVPEKDIPEKINVQVVYGAGAGLDAMAADTRVLQHLGAKLISKETSREHIDYIPEDAEEGDRILSEDMQDAMVGKFLETADWQTIANVYIAMSEEGVPIAKAIQDSIQAAPPAADPMAAMGGAPPGGDMASLEAMAGAMGGGMPSGGAAGQGLALEKGGTEEASDIGASLPPLSDVRI